MSVLDNPRLYNAVQLLGGWKLVTARRLRSALAGASGQVLDIGAGTGNVADLLPPGTTYVAVDNDPVRVRYLEHKLPTARCLLRSALDTGLEDDAVDWTVCVGLAHHLEDEDLPRLIREMARVTRKRLVFVDPLWPGKPVIDDILWRVDRGCHPRPETTLLAALRSHFIVDRVERLRPLHESLLCLARPSPG